MNKGLGPKINDLRDKGYTYNQIVAELGCSKGTVSYHLGEDQKEKHITRHNKVRKNNPLIGKLDHFRNYYYESMYGINSSIINHDLDFIIYHKMFTFTGRKIMRDFTTKDILDKIGDNPTCYLTGESIDLHKPSTYHFDHIIPRSRGGDNSLDNLGICTREANQSKFNMIPDEYFELCRKVLEYNNYKVEKL